MSAAANRKTFVNLAVSDLPKTVEFFTGLGFEFDPMMTDENSTCMTLGADSYAMIMTTTRFKDFTKKEICDTGTHTEVMVALSSDSRDEVDELADKALSLGGQEASDPIDLGFMYGRSFYDLDGHHWETFYMDLEAAMASEPPSE